MWVYMTYKYPSVRLILPEGMTSPAKIYEIGLFALKSTHGSYLEFFTSISLFAGSYEADTALHGQSV